MVLKKLFVECKLIMVKLHYQQQPTSNWIINNGDIKIYLL